MFAKEREKLGKRFTLDRNDGKVEHLADLELGDLFVFAGGREILELDEDGDDMNGGFFIAKRLLDGELVWTSCDYQQDCTGLGYDPDARRRERPLKEESPRIVRVKEKQDEL